jgi:uncharacterized protein (UPF0276 family)
VKKKAKTRLSTIARPAEWVDIHLTILPMHPIYSAIACNLDAHILLASLPLFEEEKIEAIEWSFDTLFKYSEIPDWFTDLVKEYSNQNRLIGHGVYFSLFSGKWSPKQQEWLNKLHKLSKEYQFDHITEHFGFMTGEDFHKGAPIGIPFTPVTLAIGRDRLQRIQDACNCPVGLENLAFSYSIEEVKKHGDFLNQLVESVNGFIILDLHNLYCQIHNFSLNFEDIIHLYPLDRVREIHISGGSWDDSYGRKIRRDTHDDSVPGEVFELLKKTIPLCPNLKFVVLEQMGTALNTEVSQSVFRDNFTKMDHIIKSFNPSFSNFSPNTFSRSSTTHSSQKPKEDLHLHHQQMQLSHILETAGDINQAREMLASSDLNHSEWNVEHWAPYMVETAMAIAQKWKNGFS